MARFIGLEKIHEKGEQPTNEIIVTHPNMGRLNDISSYNPWTTFNTKTKPTTKPAASKRIAAVHKDHGSSPSSPDKKQSQSLANHQTRSRTKSPSTNIASSIINEHIIDDADHDNQSLNDRKNSK
ncbi:7637_t:CDS:2 [Paraglomus brasilianum]|uniref:7637_t:CDS:1 n=1 Tax=Paraglomus brasilianum TaxID=144538 RepID=A0A9N9DCS5_9GLOM|nr:7637_t:CDS:2 [Paraglomus brasilianum]